MITFFVGTSTFLLNQRKYNPPYIVLTEDSWNDWWEYTTLYSMNFIDVNGSEHQIGGVKIGQIDLKNGRADIPNIFEELNGNFFSLGQDVTYYENINDLGDDYRERIHQSLNDVAFNEDLFSEVEDQRVTYRSLLRSVSVRSVTGQFNRLANGNATLTPYDFTYTLFGDRRRSQLVMDFHVVPKSNPPTNIHVIIGRNGVGKTYLLNNMIDSLLEENTKIRSQFSSSITSEQSNLFANLVSVTFSAFDDTEPRPERRDKRTGMSYSYIGLKTERKDIKTSDEGNTPSKKIYVTKSPVKLKNEFVKSAYGCKVGGKLKRLRNAIIALEADVMFQDADLTSILNIQDQNDFDQVAGAIFKKLSSGHKIVLLTITRLVETLEERSLVLLDEPEAHLHPPLLSAFIRALSDLLILRNAVAIVATHSPVVLQEVPKSCCWKLRRAGSEAIAERLEIESFGENVGSLTQEVFGLEVTDSSFHNLLEKIAENSDDYDEAIESFKQQLGLEGRAILRSMMLSKRN